MAPTIKRLGPGDTAAMHTLNALFGSAFEDDATYTGTPPPDDYITVTLANPMIIVLIAQSGTVCVGGLTAYVLPKLEQAHSEIYIYDLAVAEDVRRTGVATALLDEVRRIATDVGAWVVYVQADYDDPPAIALYTRHGTREEVLHFDLTPLPRT